MIIKKIEDNIANLEVDLFLTKNGMFYRAYIDIKITWLYFILSIIKGLGVK